MKQSSRHTPCAVRWLMFATAKGMCLLICAVPICTAVHGQEPTATQDQIRFFETKIRPVLIEHCYECHAGGREDRAGRSARRSS